jgi:alpha-L-fucosidase
MERRDFCKLMATAAGAALIPGATGKLEADPSSDPAGAGTIAEGFGKETGSFADFCATPEDARTFYILSGKSIVSEKLDPSHWQPTAWGKPPDLPIPGGSFDGVPMESPIPGLSGNGPYQPTWDSLLQYDCPEWYQDAKFGIWNHWSPQCVPEAGDWYARNMYRQGTRQSLYHLQHYGPPSVFGYKDLCAQWTLLNWDPESLMSLYQRAGAKLYIALANHHDGFDTWNSKHHPWNAQNIGPHRDLLGTWSSLARQRGLRFGVTVHGARNWWWFQTAHDADKSGPQAGVPYDGHLTLADGKGQWWEGYDPQRLYNAKHPEDALPDFSFVKNFYDRTRDLIDQHDPDLLYFDNALFPLGWVGMNIGAYFYNHNLQTRGGRMEGIINIKNVPDNLAKSVVADIERGLTSEIRPYPWQSETCIGGWHYDRALFEHPGEYGGYLPPRDVIHWMADAVSKNGIFILNVPGKPDGTIDSKEQLILERVGAWMRINGEAIYSTRPWKVYGEGPHTIKSGSFQGKSIAALGSDDIRFTRNKAGTVVYAICLGWPKNGFFIRSLGGASAAKPGKIDRVELLGTDEQLSWRQTDDALRVERPVYTPPDDIAVALKVTLA